MTRTTKSGKSTIARTSKRASSKAKKTSRAVTLPKQHLLREMMKKIKKMFKESIAYLMNKEKQMLQRITKQLTSVRRTVSSKSAKLSLSR